jgi:hypothetical protein
MPGDRNDGRHLIHVANSSMDDGGTSPHFLGVELVSTWF